MTLLLTKIKHSSTYFYLKKLADCNKYLNTKSSNHMVMALKIFIRRKFFFIRHFDQSVSEYVNKMSGHWAYFYSAQIQNYKDLWNESYNYSWKLFHLYITLELTPVRSVLVNLLGKSTLLLCREKRKMQQIFSVGSQPGRSSPHTPPRFRVAPSGRLSPFLRLHYNHLQIQQVGGIHRLN